jgi:hypothetical protein
MYEVKCTIIHVLLTLFFLFSNQSFLEASIDTGVNEATNEDYVLIASSSDEDELRNSFIKENELFTNKDSDPDSEVALSRYEEHKKLF